MERQPSVNNHHTWFEKRRLNAFRLSSLIRDNDRTQVLMPVEIHNDLHANTHGLPVPSAFVARLALERIVSRPSTFTPLDIARDSEEYLRSIGEQYHDDALNISDRLLEQIPFIQLGVDSLKRRHL